MYLPLSTHPASLRSEHLPLATLRFAQEASMKASLVDSNAPLTSRRKQVSQAFARDVLTDFMKDSKVRRSVRVTSCPAPGLLQDPMTQMADEAGESFQCLTTAASKQSSAFKLREPVSPRAASCAKPDSKQPATRQPSTGQPVCGTVGKQSTKKSSSPAHARRSALCKPKAQNK